ncbi:MAG: hypothetical protein HYW26_00395 [Candidatus Aenigmarchaeota archaeon]|nr:hypothetical protein [Candidatus Aenigmarchaeota archaeon]
MFEYRWKNNEANFGLPLPRQVKGGTHVTFEILLKRKNKYIALRRPKGIPEHELPPHAADHPEGLLYFCHNLIRYGESVEKCIKRIVKAQAGVNVRKWRVVAIDSVLQEKDGQWAIIPHVIAEVDRIPEKSGKITEIVFFSKNKIPGSFAWWTRKELEEFLRKYE